MSALRRVTATSTQRCAVARLDEPARRGNALAEDPAHLVARAGVDVAAQRVAAAPLVDAEVLDRDPARAWPRSRPVNAIEHAYVPPRLSLSGQPAPRCPAVSPGSGGRLADGARVCSAGRNA